MTRIRLLSAFQVLTLPDGILGAKHTQARKVICEILGLDELPAENPTPQPSIEAYLAEWLNLELTG
jgi:hypothetical protein